MPPKQTLTKKQESLEIVLGRIESAKTARLNKIILNDAGYLYKNYTNNLANALRWIYRCEDRICSTFLHILIDLNFEKYFSEGSKEKPELIVFETPRAPSHHSPPDERTIHAFNWLHSCIKNVTETKIVEVDNFQSGKIDSDYFMKLINDHPYETPIFFKRQAEMNVKAYKSTMVDRMVADYRRIMFPRNEKEILNPLFCKTLIQLLTPN